MLSERATVGDLPLDEPWNDQPELFEDAPELSDAESAIVERFGQDMFGGEEDTVGRYWADVHGVKHV